MLPLGLRGRLLLLAVPLFTAASCTRSGFDVDSGREPTDGGPQDYIADTRGHDLPRDLPRDIAPDFGPPPGLSCEAPQLVSAFASHEVENAALFPDGKRLVIEGRGAAMGTLLSATRPAVAAPYGAVVTYSDLPSGAQDLLFDDVQGGIQALLAATPPGGGPRRLFRCAIPSATLGACDTLELFRNPGEPIKSDTDGVALFVGPQGPQLAFNLELGADAGDIFLASPLDASLLRWQARAQTSLNTPSKEDDPGFHPDGRLMIFDRAQNSGASADLFYVTRASPELPFNAAPKLVEGVNSKAIEGGPEIFVLPNKRFELYFNSDRLGTGLRLYRAICRYQ